MEEKKHIDSTEEAIRVCFGSGEKWKEYIPNDGVEVHATSGKTTPPEKFETIEDIIKYVFK